MTTVINHPDSFKTGIRVFTSVLRNKDKSDGQKKRKSYVLISRNVQEFDDNIVKITKEMTDGERLYVSVHPCDARKAVKTFKQAQVEADYNPDYLSFYISAKDRFASSLMKNPVKKDRLWLLDIDSDKEYSEIENDILTFYDRSGDMTPYTYKTKNGHHIILKPFNSTECSDTFKSCLNKNALMLWAY